jgi:fructosamine-3-kinase
MEFSVLSAGTHRLHLPDGLGVFAKVRRDMPADFFAAEARGLTALATASPLRVPRIIAIWNHGIALEDLGSGHARAHDWECAGQGLATMHRSAGERFGFDAPGWCGDSEQENVWDGDGLRFFAERRLLPQGQRARDCGRLDANDSKRLEALCTHLHELLLAHAPVLIHGDLWLGNLHACADGELALIDGGAVHYGWAESDLAMLTLFGEPPAAFFSAYQAQAGIDADWRQRAPLLNLYHLLNHLNLFGESYRGAVRSVLARYA